MSLIDESGHRMNYQRLSVKIFADGANLEEIKRLSRDPMISGFTTNPTLMRQAGVVDYEEFSRAVIAEIGGRPLSLEVFSDDFAEMANQARQIASWGSNVYVKIPVSNTSGEPSTELVRELAFEGIQLNVTALMTVDQVRTIAKALNPNVASYISVFAGRIADTGVDPVPTMRTSYAIMSALLPKGELIWASPREVLNVIQADQCGCQVITVTPDVLKKLSSVGKDLDLFSRETVQMFYNDGVAAGYTLSGLSCPA
jgi:transaldolase